MNGVAGTYNLDFATFPTLAAWFEKHGQLISQGTPYRNVWQQYGVSKDVPALVHGMAPIYATAPNYPTTLLSSMPQVASASARQPSAA